MVDNKKSFLYSASVCSFLPVSAKSGQVFTGHSMNVPNSLTILRILLIPVFIGFLIYERYNHALIIILIAGLTDALDGTIARITNQRTKLGAYLDPLADKLLLTAGFVTLSVLHLVPLWVAILVVSRDSILLTGALLSRFTESSLDMSPTFIGKGTTLFQLLYIILIIIFTARHVERQLLQPLLYLMVALTVSSGLHYLYRGVTHLNTREA